MAAIKILSEGWTLSDGVLSPIRLDAPTDVRGALVAAGYAQSRPTGLQPLADEWTYRRVWTYETDFEMPEEDERAMLACDCLEGYGRVLVNGREVCAFAPGALKTEIGAFINDGVNRLALAFDPANGEAVGLFEAPRLYTGNFLCVEGARATGSFGSGEGEIAVALSLNAHTAGRYVFKYVVALGDEAVTDCLLTERLRIGQRSVLHSIKIKNPAAYDRTEETVYTVRLSIERSGVGCALRFFPVALLGAEQRAARVCRLAPCGPALRAHRLGALKELGANGVSLPCGELSPAEGFLPVEGAAPAIDRPALKRAEDMLALAGEERFWPADSPVWRLTGSVSPDQAEYERLFGPNALGDAARAARLSRYLQAEALRSDALRARTEGRSVLLAEVFEDRERFAGPALIEADGRRRPAFRALKAAWADIALYAVLPDEGRATPGENLSIPLWIVSDAVSPLPLTVRAACFDQSGATLAGASYPAFAVRAGAVGNLSVAVPRTEQALTVRLEAAGEDGEILARWDGALCVSSGEYPLAPLLNLPGTLVLTENETAVNAGRTVAFAAAGEEYRALLPGERMPCSDGFECLNAI